MMRPALPLLLAFLCGSSRAGDWPGFLGPQRNGVAAEDEAIPARFPSDAAEPETLWERPVGAGFAGPAVAGETVILFHRLGDEARCEALDAASGEPRWSFGYPTDYRDDFGFDAGPRAVPLIAGGRVFLYGAEGMLHCLDAATGAKEWAVDLAAEHGSGKGFFGRAPSPLRHRDTLIVQAGGAGAGLLGFDTADGSLRWKCSDDEAGYASPTLARVGGAERLLALTREGLLCADPTDGSVLAEHPFRSSNHASVNAATPLFFPPDRVFLSACYDVGAALLELDLPGRRVTEAWAAGGKLDAHYATPAPHEGHLYGFHGRQESGTSLRCIAIETGEVAWDSGRLAAGSVTLAGGTLVVLTERGELVLAPATPEGFEPTARAQILGNGTRAFPALSGGRLYARDTKRLVCVALR